jgi:type I restriction enzyme, S subunit
MSFPRYPKYKDSGVEWLGEVPEGWRTSKIGRVASIKYGIGEPPEYYDEGTPLIRATNVHAGKLFAEGLVFVDPAEIPEKRILWLESGDIVVVRSGAYTGDSAIIPQGFGRCIAGFDMVLRCHSAMPQFVQFALLSTYLRDRQIDLERMRAAQPHLNAEELGSCLLLLPPSDEQSRIAEFLDRETAKIDELVAEQQRLMELLKEKRQAVISHAVTKGLNPIAPMKPSGIEWLGDVPEHWEVLELKRIATIQTGVAKGKDNGSRCTISVPYLRVANVQDGYLDLEDVATIEIPEEDLPRYTLRTGDVLMNEGGDFDKLGRGCVWNGEIDPCIGQNHVFAVRPRDGLSAWVATFTGSDSAQSYFMSRSKQSTNLASISSTNLMELPLTLPPAAERQAILSLVTAQTSSFDALAAEAQKAIDLLQERRTALISAAVTGQIDVRKFAAA